MNTQSISRLVGKANQWRFELTFREVRDILAASGIDVLVLKGPHLAYTVYDDPEQREYCDLDLLVKPSDFMAAAKILFENGYTPIKWDRRKLVSSHIRYNWGFISPQGIAVELHRDLSGFTRYRTDVNSLFRESESFRFGDTEARGLGTEDLLTHLCLHAGKSYFYSIQARHIADIDVLIRKRSVDWERFFCKCRVARVTVAAFFTLSAAVSQHHTPVPWERIHAMAPGKMRKTWILRFLAVDTFPMYRFPDHSDNQVRRRLLLPLMDRKRDWPAFIYRYIYVLLLDAALSVPPVRRAWLDHHPFKQWIEGENAGL